MRLQISNPPTFFSLSFQWVNLLTLMEPTMPVRAKTCKCIYMDLIHIFGPLCVGVPQLGKGEVATAEHEHDLFRNAQAVRVIKTSLCTMEYNKVRGIISAKEIWETPQMLHEGNDEVKEGKMDLLQGDLEAFVMKKR